SVGDGVAVVVGEGDAPGGAGVAGGGGGHLAGQGRVDGAQAVGLAGVLGHAEHGGQRDGQHHVGRQGSAVPGGPRRRADWRVGGGGRGRGGSRAGGGCGGGRIARGGSGGRGRAGGG